ncbi:hypothetical protein SGLAM104S_07754 [Streptomyces glaucescens]
MGWLAFGDTLNVTLPVPATIGLPPLMTTSETVGCTDSAAVARADRDGESGQGQGAGDDAEGGTHKHVSFHMERDLVTRLPCGS